MQRYDKGTAAPTHDEPTSYSTPPDRRTGRLVVLGNRVVDIDQDSCVRRLVSSRERHKRRRATTATILDLDLRTREIELQLDQRQRPINLHTDLT